MPTINTLPKKPKTSSRNETEMRELRQKTYSNTAWRKLRETYLIEHPLCEDCLAEGKVTPATDVHHIKSPFRKGDVNWILLLDYNNLASLCKEHHGARHAAEQGHISPAEVLKQLDDLLNENIKDEDLE